MSDSKPYGAWIAPNGDLIPVEMEAHFEKAIEILTIDESLVSTLSWRDVYGKMYDSQYLRLIFRFNIEEGYSLEYYNNQSITWQQKDWIKKAFKCCLVERYLNP